MNLNCLGQSLQRTKSDKDFRRRYGQQHQVKKISGINVDRSWSGNLAPHYEQIRKASRVQKVKKSHRRLNSTGAVSFETNSEPKLVRSVGMRRDWSFEDLRQRNHEKRRAKWER